MHIIGAGPCPPVAPLSCGTSKLWRPREIIGSALADADRPRLRDDPSLRSVQMWISLSVENFALPNFLPLHPNPVSATLAAMMHKSLHARGMTSRDIVVGISKRGLGFLLYLFFFKQG